MEGEGGNPEVPPDGILGDAEARPEEEGGTWGKHGFPHGSEQSERRSVIYEVFRQERKGQAFAHAGSVEAPNEAFAEAYAREQYGRRGESTALWVVAREHVLPIEEFVDELNRNYHRVDGYPLKEKLKEARARAGATPARDR